MEKLWGENEQKKYSSQRKSFERKKKKNICVRENRVKKKKNVCRPKKTLMQVKC